MFVLKGTAEIDAATVQRERRWTDRRDDHGPFDFIGDVHGCADELVELLGELGYQVAVDRLTASHPAGRKAFYVGDLVDRGPDSVGVLRLVMGMVRDGNAACIPGNHENKLWRALNGHKVQVSHGLAETLAQLDGEPEGFRVEVADFIDSLVSHAVLDDGLCVVAHAGLPERLHNRSSGVVRSFALYGDITGETDEFGLPIRYPWANDYRGAAVVVYGHTPVPDAEWINNTICIDTGCVFGGKLTALRYPERELVSVRAARTYWEPVKPLRDVATDAERHGALLDATDVLGRRIVDTRPQPRITIGADRAAAAFEVMSRWAIDPRWLIYLPPTMAPTATSDRLGLLEHPAQAFSAYRRAGVAQVICEEKHMRSRAVVVVCRDAEVAARRFHIDDPVGGTVYTRTGRAFFPDAVWQARIIERTRDAIAAADLWDGLDTDWLALDSELLPWSAKAGDLIRSQYAAVGAAGHAMTARAGELLSAAFGRGADVADLVGRTRERAQAVDGFIEAYWQYCWTVEGPDDLQIAPFVVLASEGDLLAQRDHGWHMSIADRLVAAGDRFIRPTRNLTVDLHDSECEAAAIAWWEELVSGGGEGMVVKPLASIVTSQRGLIQPGIKCRGPEYLRIIYGPDCLAPHNLERLRDRGVGKKRSLAQQEFALGIEALERFVAGEPLHRVHECVFGVLAMESEPVDPRL